MVSCVTLFMRSKYRDCELNFEWIDHSIEMRRSAEELGSANACFRRNSATQPRQIRHCQELGADRRRQPKAAITPGTQQSGAVARKVVLYEDPAHPSGKRFVGSAIWRAETAQPPELAARTSKWFRAF